jgi:hypothetical protein
MESSEARKPELIKQVPKLSRGEREEKSVRKRRAPALLTGAEYSTPSLEYAVASTVFLSPSPSNVAPQTSPVVFAEVLPREVERGAMKSE